MNISDLNEEKQETVQLVAQVPKDMKDELFRYAEENDMSMAQAVRFILRGFLFPDVRPFSPIGRARRGRTYTQKGTGYKMYIPDDEVKDELDRT